MSYWTIITEGDPHPQFVTSLDGLILTGKTVIEGAPEDWRMTPYIWNGEECVPDVSTLRAVLTNQVDRAREPTQAQNLTDGDAKKVAYALKAMEVADWRRIGSDDASSLIAFEALSEAQQQARFRFALAEAALTGETIDLVIARFEDGANDSLGPIAHLEALAVIAKREIEAAIEATEAASIAGTAIDQILAMGT